MANYKEIHGVKVQYRDSDATAVEGDVWYNASTSKLKMYAADGSWASGGNTNTGVDAAGYCGIQTAAMYFGGRGGSPITTRIDTSETYNGSSWTETNDLQTATYQNAGFGTTSAAISAGGLSPSATTAVETFDGTNWAAAPGSLNGAKRQVRGTGTQTAGMVAFATPSPQRQLTELYDGSTWTESGDTNNPKIGVPLVGVTTAALAIGGQNPSDQGSTDCETFNGSVWAVADGTMNDGRINAGGAGSTTAGLVFGGYGGGGSTVATANTETYDGTTWAEGANLATARDFILSGQASPNTTALAFGGQVPPSATVSNSTEEWTAPATFRQFSIGDIYYNADPSSGVIKYVGYGTGAWA